MSAVSPEPVKACDAAFARGDAAALRAAYDAHGALVYSFCCRRLDPERAKDATQEVFISAWKARERFDPNRASLAAWLVGIAKHRIVDNLRAEGRHSNRRAAAADIDVGVEVGVDAEVDRVGDRMLVANGLAELPDRTRNVIELAYLHGLTHAEIASRTSLPVGTVKSDIRRGLLRIRAHLGVSDG